MGMDSSRIDATFLVIFVASFTFSLCQLPVVDAYKILILPAVAKSHVFSLMAVADGLVSKGHEVTIVVGKTFPLDVPEVKVGQQYGIHIERLEDSIEDYDALFENLTMTMLTNEFRMSDIIPIMRQRSAEACRGMVTRNEVLFNRLGTVGFDLAVVDGIFFFKCIYLIPHRLQIPYVTYADVIDPFVVRVPWLPSFVPTTFLPFTDQMTFVERLKNTFVTLAFSFSSPIPDSPAEVFDEYRTKYGYFSDLDDLMERSQMWLLTGHDVLDYAKPMMPNMVKVGGLTLKRSSGELPNDLRSFVEGAEKGAIVVSFGSMVSSFPTPIAVKFLDAFKRLNGYRFVWRLVVKEKLQIPDNVMIMRWIPQNDLLAHENVKLFITHSGNNGQFEALYHGVPMLGLPLLGDQEHNAARLQYKGYGIYMNIFDFTSDELLSNVRRVIEDVSYKKRISKASEIFRSDPMNPIEKASFWIEHVCKFGSDHLRSGGQDLPLYAYHMLDVMALASVAFGLLVYCMTRVGRFFWRKVCMKSRQKIKVN